MHGDPRAFVLAIAWLVCAAGGCQRPYTGPSTLNTTVAGRSIQAVVDGRAFLHPEADSATVSFASHKVVVEKARVLLDGKEIATIAGDVPIEVAVKDNTLTVSADGNVVATKALE